jgi:glyoxylase-like metal-dependent hydrolase (beta-lactamase superfamily II)
VSTTYDGKVTPGKGSQTFLVDCLEVSKVAVDPEMSNNCYLLRCTETGEQVLVDAAAEPETLRELIGDGGLSAIVTTHQHWDHHRALGELVDETSATTIAGAPDADAITEQTGCPIDREVGDGDTITVGACTLSVIAIAGHTPGSICLYYDGGEGKRHLFTGDSLFPGGVGATFGDDEAFRQLIDEVSTKIFGELPDDVVLHPGHGDDGVLGNERSHLEEWRERGW